MKRTKFLLKIIIIMLVVVKAFATESIPNNVVLTTPDIQVYEPLEKRIFKFLIGKRPDNRIYYGMFTVHIPWNEEHRSCNWGMGFLFNSFFCLTFLNSYSNRSVAFGIHRDLFVIPAHRYIDLLAGYSLGLIYGYKDITLCGVKFYRFAPLLTFHGGFQVSISDTFKLGISLMSNPRGGIISSLLYFTFKL